MRYFYYIRNAVISTIFGALVLVGTVLSVNAQDQSQAYLDWQRAQARAEQKHQDYLRSRDMWNYNQWQAAQRRAQEQYLLYQQESSRYNNGYDNNGYNNNNNSYYNNNGYNNNGYNNSYNSGQYRVYRNGSYYMTDSRGSEMLRQAVRNGYSIGYREGQMDRQYGRGDNYNNDRMYRSGNYGYESSVDRSQYQYYFQRGFQRGYEDGYYNRMQYGYRSGNGVSIAAGILSTILNLSNR